MKLTAIKIDGFGVWNDLHLEDLPEGIIALHGPNEAGKTTLMHFVRAMLYGYSAERRRRFLPPVYGGAAGGELGLKIHKKNVRLERYADADTVVGQLTMTGVEGKLPAESTLRGQVGDIDEATFNNVYAVGLREMQELGTLSDTDAARWLYSLTTGLDRVSLLDVVRALRKGREELLSSEGRPSKITGLMDRRLQLQDEIDQLIAKGRKWAQIVVKVQELGGEIAKHETERDRLEYQARIVEIGINAKPKWLQRIDLDRQIALHEGNVRLPDDAISRLDSLDKEIDDHARHSGVLKEQRKEIKEKIGDLKVREILVRSAARVDALGEQRDWLEALERQQETLRTELAEIQAELTSKREEIGIDLQTEKSNFSQGPELTESMLSGLRPHAKAVRACRERLASAQTHAENQHATTAEYIAQLSSAMPNNLGVGLPTNVEGAGDLVSNLRKRVQVDERFEQAKRHEVELVQQNHELLDRQESPLWMTAATGLIGFFGIALLASGLWGYTTFAAFGGVILLVLAVLAFLSRVDKDRVFEQREAIMQQVQHARKQIETAERDRSELEQTLGPISGSIIVRLQTAERHLTELEKLIPVESRKRDAQLEAESANRRVLEAERKLENAVNNWKGKLKAIGLPENLSPAEIRAIASRYEQVSDLRLRADERRGDVELRQREYSILCKRIHDLAEEVHLLDPELSPLEQLEHLQSQLRQQWIRVEERDQLQAKSVELENKDTQHVRSVETLKHRLETMFAQAGAEDEAGYRHLFHEQKHADKLRKERATVCREINAAIGSQVPEQEVAELLLPETIGALDRNWEEITTNLETVEELLKDVVAERGGLRQELKQLSEDETLAEKQLDLGEVEEQLKRSVKDWRSAAAFNIVIDEIRSRYEKERQPETLIEASEYMTRLTRGAYGRIWTPLGKELLFVDNADGESLPVEILSRGTREQIFLSLRLALVALLGRRGIKLPMVLDDVLVNFDEGRARQAVRVLAKFAAEGHQVFVFTCHEHVWHMFKDEKLEARRLPTRFGAQVHEEPKVIKKAKPKPKPVKVEKPKVEKPKVNKPKPVAMPVEIKEKPIPNIDVSNDVEYMFDGEDFLAKEPVKVEPPKLTLPKIVLPKPEPKPAVLPPAAIYISARTLEPMEEIERIELPTDETVFIKSNINPIWAAPVPPPVVEEETAEPIDFNDDWVRIGPTGNTLHATDSEPSTIEVTESEEEVEEQTEISNRTILEPDESDYQAATVFEEEEEVETDELEEAEYEYEESEYEEEDESEGEEEDSVESVEEEAGTEESESDSEEVDESEYEEEGEYEEEATTEEEAEAEDGEEAEYEYEYEEEDVAEGEEEDESAEYEDEEEDLDEDDSAAA